MCGLNDRTSHCASLNNLVQPHIFYRICQKGISAPNYYWGDSKNQLTHEVIVKTCRNVCTVENEVVFERKKGTNLAPTIEHLICHGMLPLYLIYKP